MHGRKLFNTFWIATILCVVGCSQQRWHSPCQTSFSPPHSRFHPVPTEPVFGKRWQPKSVLDHVVPLTPAPFSGGAPSESFPAPNSMPIRPDANTSEDLLLPDLDSDVTLKPANRSAREAELRMVPEVPAFALLVQPIHQSARSARSTTPGTVIRKTSFYP